MPTSNPMPQMAGEKTFAGNGTVSSKTDHTLFQDVYGIVTASALVALGLCLLKAGGMVTGGATGLGLLVSYVVPWPPAVLLTLINLPFFAFSWRIMGPRFTIKSLCGNFAILLIAEGLNASVDFNVSNPGVVGVLSGIMIGIGFLALARHQTGVGAVGIVAMWLNRAKGVNIGTSQIVMDCIILGLGFPLISTTAWFWSIASALAVASVPFIWHRPGRYIPN